MASVKKLLNLLKLFLGWPLALIAIIFILRYLLVNSGSVLPRLSHINPTLLFISTITFLIYYFLRALGWGLMMSMMGYKIKLRKSFYAWQFSEIKRYVPGNIWSFLSRASLFEELGVPKKQSAKAILYEVEFLVCSNLILSLLSVGIISKYFGNNTSKLLLILGTSGIMIVFLLIFGYKISKSIATILPNFGISRNLLILVYYAITFFFLALGVYLATASILGFNTSGIFLIGFFAFSFLIGYLSIITPSGLGVREGIITFGLTSFFTTPIAGLIAIFSRIVLVTSELLFALVIFVWYKFK